MRAWLLVLAFVCAVVAFDCNGHGMYYPEEQQFGLPPACSCFQCFAGDNCESEIPDCELETHVAEATLFTEWFVQRKEHLAINFSANYHFGYLLSPRVFPPAHERALSDGSHPSVPNRFDRVSELLNTSIRELHHAVGNIDSSEYTLVVGSGGVQVLDAALYALTQVKSNVNKSMEVFAQSPYYPHFRMASNLNPLTRWSPDNSTNRVQSNLIEIVTTPNNPDGETMSARYPESSLVHDFVYLWPHYGAEIRKRDEAVQLYSFSKLTGMAASRIGWAFVKDPEVAAIMSNYMWLQSTAPSVEAQLRSVKVLRAITASLGTSDDYFDYARNVLRDRWTALRKLFATQSRFELVGKGDLLFMWIRCNEASDAKDCTAPFGNAGIAADNGANYGSTDNHVRICMGHHSSEFEMLYSRLATLMKL